MSRISIVFAALLAGLAPLGLAGAPDPASVVVLANTQVPESEEVAAFYMAARGIPSNHLCRLSLPAGELISREDYENNLRDPLLRHLRELRLVEQAARAPGETQPHESAWLTQTAKVRYLVPVFGIPVRIADTPAATVKRVIQSELANYKRDAAAVDSELSLLLYAPYDICGPLNNPCFGSLHPDDVTPPAKWIMAVSRLDGPGPAVAKQLVTDALAGERYGLVGRVYIDSRGMLPGGFGTMDHKMREAGVRFWREGYACVTDQSEATWLPSFPMSDAAVYLGWYAGEITGPFEISGFRFMTGAMAYHLHSGSAESLRAPTVGWVAPLVLRGAAASAGAVNEPFLDFTPQPDILADRLCQGYPFGDCVLMAQPALSWQMTVIGDPLYQPFKLSLEQQIANLEAGHRPEVAWAYIRKANQMMHAGQYLVAQEYLQVKQLSEPSPILAEFLGDLASTNGLQEEALAQWRTALTLATAPTDGIRCGTKLLLALRQLGRQKEAQATQAEIQKRWTGRPELLWMHELIARDMAEKDSP